MRCYLDWRVRGRRFLAVTLATLGLISSGRGGYLDTIGVTLLRSVSTNLNGSGVRVAQVEAAVTSDPPAFEVNPASVQQPLNRFTYYSDLATSSAAPPNAAGAESSHANSVGSYFYGLNSGVATNIAHVDNYLADHFYYAVIAAFINPDINVSVVNQSFVFGAVTIPQQQELDSDYDDYAAEHNVLFVSGPGNGGIIEPPATCYNGIAVGAYGGFSSVGPTPDNGRAKPDICAPANYTSFSTPQAAGTAAMLIQAALRGDGGADTNAASDMRTIKALLLNGAIKPPNWTNSINAPLDARYGAGVLNAYNSYQHLAFGEHGWITSTTVLVGNPHPPTGAAGSVNALSGWDYSTINSTSTSDRVNHYYFDVTNAANDAPFNATATLVWNRLQGESDINDLDLFLYDAATSNLLASSVSLVDNVEHLFVPDLPQGRYDLQVLKNGGNGGKRVTNSDTYALAFEFFNMSLDITRSDTNAVITWPVYPAGFTLEWASSLDAASWTTNTPEPMVVGNQYQAVVDPSIGAQFFRLRRP